MNLVDRMLRKVGLARMQQGASASIPFNASSRSRLLADWATSLLSPDQETRVSLRDMRSRSRHLANNNDYVSRFLSKAKENVIGSNGISLQMTLDDKTGASKFNQPIEDAWRRWQERCTADGRMSFVDYCQLGLASQLQDGELFTRKVKGYPYNATRFALQMIDPDQIDIMLNRLRRPGDVNAPNELRMGIELDEWRRPVAYWAFDGHPSEVVGVTRLRIPAQEIEHSYSFRRINQTRGVPWLHSAMTRLHMLAGYEEAELVAARLEACKMGYYTSKTGDEYKGTRNATTGVVETQAQPGHWEQLPEGVTPVAVDFNHPNSAFPEFVRALLRGAAMGLNVSYSTLAGDLRDVNFSSLRQGVLDEREGWKVLQTFARDHLVAPVFADWLPMAITTGQLDLPAQLPLDLVCEAATWTARGWDWVDPLKDGQADIMAMRSGMGTLQDSCAKRGKDWREQLEQRAKENEYAKKLGIAIDLTTNGSGGIEGATQDESQPGAPAAAPATPPRKPVKPNGAHNEYVRLPQ